MINIYKITNLYNGKIYIGQTKNSVEFRFKQHLREGLNRTNNSLHSDMVKQNKEGFLVELLEQVENREEADERERFWIEFYNSTNPEYGYNLDTGGVFGGKKNSLTCEKIRNQSLKNWEDKVISERMRNGLAKATEKWVEISKEQRIDFTCPICNKEMKLIKSDKRKTCGDKKCVEKMKAINGTNLVGINKASEFLAEKRKNRNSKIYEFVVVWAQENKDIVMSCPKNKITTTLNDLLSQCEKNFDIKDIRSIAKICCNSTSKITFLDWLKEQIEC